MMTRWSFTTHREPHGRVRLDLTGDLRGEPSRGRLRTVLRDTLESDSPDELVIDLGGVSALDGAGIEILLAAYITAIQHGVSYRAIGSRGAARCVLLATGMVEVLADSDDVEALQRAVASRGQMPHPRSATG